MPAGRLAPSNWKVTAVRAGTYSLRYRVAAGIDGKAMAESFDGSGAAKGSFIARVIARAEVARAEASRAAVSRL